MCVSVCECMCVCVCVCVYVLSDNDEVFCVELAIKGWLFEFNV